MDTKGYYKKFDITYADTGKAVEGKTFTLLPERDPHARVAVLAYAASIESDNPDLATELRSEFA